MTDEQFDVLVQKLEPLAQKHPGVYKLRLALLAALGYAFLLGMVLMLLAGVIVIAYSVRFNGLIIKVLLIPLGLVAVVLRSLWIHFPEPDGYEVKRADAPRLFDLVDEVRRAAQGPRLHHVLINDEFNAGIVQIPRLGVFGWHTNYLTLGLRLMEALSPEEFRAVLTHEFGHLSGRHGHFSAWIYRVRQTWVTLLSTLQEQRRTGYEIFEAFFKWYAPFFGAYSFVLARAQEYEADRRAVELAGKDHAAQALIRMELKDRLLQDRFWPDFYKQADQLPEPPKDILTQMLAALKKPLDEKAANKWFGQSLNVRTSSADTHPSLAARLKAMDYPMPSESDDEALKELPAWKETLADNAASRYLNDVPADYLASRNRWWRELIAQSWRQRHEFVQTAQATLKTLQDQSQTRPLNMEERWQQIRLIVETQNASAAMPMVREIIAAEPDQPVANFLMGQALLEQGDEAGVELIEKAMKQDRGAVVHGCVEIYGFLIDSNRLQEAETYRLRAREAQMESDNAAHERLTLHPGDKFTGHELDKAGVASLREQLENHEQLDIAYLVRKAVRYFPEEPFYVLGIIRHRDWHQGRSIDEESRLVANLAELVQLPGPALVINLEGEHRHLRGVFKGIDGAEIWRRQ